jgi:hypothetical protein
MRSFLWLCLCASVSVSCRRHDDFDVVPAPPEFVDIGVGDRGDHLIFYLPGPEWRRIEETPFRGFLFGKGDLTLRVVIVLKEGLLDPAAVKAGSDPDAVVRAFEVARGWPFVGAVVSYRGPPDDAMLRAFIRSFKVERR